MKLLKTALRFCVRYPLAFLASVGVIVATIFLVKFIPGFNPGGLLARLWGIKRERKSRIETINEVPKGRKVAVDQPDSQGFVQPKAFELNISNNPFRDKSKVKTVSGEEFELPEGVVDTDVDTVVEIAPKVHIAKLKDDTSKRKATISTEEGIKNTEGLLERLSGR